MAVVEKVIIRNKKYTMPKYKTTNNNKNVI
jgi:hypothetical protein